MSYWLKTLIGAALFLGSVALFNVKLLELLETGTCASGGPYVSARPCPEGTGADVMLLMASVFGGLIGAGLFAFRGDPPGGRKRKPVSGGLLAWALFFGVTGAVSLYASLTDDSLGDDAKLGGAIVGATFLLMGLPVLVYVIWAWVGDLREPKPDERFMPSSGASTPTPVPRPMPTPGPYAGSAPTPAPAPAADPGEDQIAQLDQLERLQRLRESGALTEAEFEAQKRKILGS